MTSLVIASVIDTEISLLGSALPEPLISHNDELVCLGHTEDLELQQGALAPPIVQTSLFAQRDFSDLVASLNDEYRARVYTRGNNPTVQAVEQKIAQLERGAACRLTGSGMAAVSAVMMSCLQQGDHIVFAGQTYGPTLNLARRLERFGVTHTLVPSVSVDRVREQLTASTRLLWMESPSTMVFETFDIAALVELARKNTETNRSAGGRSTLTAIDNSWASPLFQKPLTQGVDYVVHSATKYIGGHSDVVAGAVVCSESLMEPLFKDAYLLGGAALGPTDAWLLNRGLRTLPARMRQHHAGGLAVARFLQQRVGRENDAAPGGFVRRVMHPGLQCGSHNLAGYSGLFSFELALQGSDRGRHFQQISTFLDALERFRIGVSWGGVESLAISPARDGNAEALEQHGVPYGTIRLSVGLEPVEVLCRDLEQALDRAFA